MDFAYIQTLPISSDILQLYLSFLLLLLKQVLLVLTVGPLVSIAKLKAKAVVIFIPY